MQTRLALLTFSAVLLCGYAAKLPSYITKCKITDSECERKSAQAALPYFKNGEKQFNIPSLNPFVVEKVEIDHGGLKLTFRNMKLHFVDNLQFLEIRADLANKQVGYAFNTPNIQMLADYEASGNILLLPVNGKGQCNMTLVNVTLDCTFDFQLDRRPDGHDYFQVSSSKKCFPKQLSRVYYDFANLFNGDKFLSETTLTFLNENWKDVSDEFNPAFLDVFTTLQDNILNNFVSEVPADEIFLP